MRTMLTTARAVAAGQPAAPGQPAALQRASTIANAARPCLPSVPPRRTISTATVVDGGRSLSIDGYEYPAIYLRDNCPASVHPTTLQRTVPVWDLPPSRELTLDTVDVQRGGDNNGAATAATVRYTDGHTSTFPASWFPEHRLDDASRLERHVVGARELKSWAGTQALPGGELIALDFEEVMGGGDALLVFLDATATWGFVKLTGVGAVEGQFARLAELVGHARETNYGTTFNVKVCDDAAINQAFTSAALPLHTDLPFYQLPPGVQVLHCIEQATLSPEAGRSLFVDGLAVAKRLREVDAAAYRVLCDVPVVFEDVFSGEPGEPGGAEGAKGFHLRAERPVITEFSPSPVVAPASLASALDLGLGAGEAIPVEVNFNDGVRASEMNVAPAMMVEFYSAIAAFAAIAHSPEMAVEIKLQAGEAVAFQNRRVLHGRRAIEGGEGGEEGTGEGGGGSNSRWLQGGYIDLDAIHSKRRALRVWGR